MKYIGAAVVPVFLTFLSVSVSLKMKKRARVLEATYYMLSEIKLSLAYSCLPTDELVSQLSRKDCYAQTFICECKTKLDNGSDFPDAWSESVLHANIFRPDEKQKLLQLGGYLGTSDLERQVSVIDMYLISFDEYRKEAQTKSKKYADTIIYVGVFCALGLFVMMI